MPPSPQDRYGDRGRKGEKNCQKQKNPISRKKKKTGADIQGGKYPPPKNSAKKKFERKKPCFREIPPPPLPTPGLVCKKETNSWDGNSDYVCVWR